MFTLYKEQDSGCRTKIQIINEQEMALTHGDDQQQAEHNMPKIKQAHSDK